MGARQFLWTTLLAALCTWFVPRDAAACACCGSDESARVIGWAPDGKAAVVHRQVLATCETAEFLEVWTAGAEAPEYCLSAYADDPAEPIDCDDVGGTHPNGPFPDMPKPLRLPKGFEPTARVLPSGQVSLWSQGDAGDEGGLRLEVFTRAGFSRVRLSATMRADDGATLGMSVWPAPKGRRALVLSLEGTDEELSTRVAWVRLPTGVDRAALAEETEYRSPVAVPRAPEPDAPDVVGRRLARARVHARAGDFDRALSYAEGVINDDPGNLLAWSEYSRFLVHAGLIERAADVLVRMRALGCARCSARVAEMLADPAFAQVRSLHASWGGRR